MVNGLPLLDKVPGIVQERAWSSPFRYQPFSPATHSLTRTSSTSSGTAP